MVLSLIHISEPTRPLYISYAVFCLKKNKKKAAVEICWLNSRHQVRIESTDSETIFEEVAELTYQ